jgi:O-antigen/teichoic acid export membrane protein
MFRFALHNAAFTLIADVATRLSGTIFMIMVARQLGKADLGRYVLGNSYVFLLVPVVFWGFDQIFIRDVASDQIAVGQQFSNYLALRLIISTLLWAFLAAFMMIVRPYEVETNRFIAILGGLLVSEGCVNLAQTYLVLVNDSWVSAGVAVVAGFIRVLAAYLLLPALGHSRFVPALLVLVGWLQAGALFFFVARCLQFTPHLLDRSFCRVALLSAFPLVPIGLMVSIEAQIGTLILSFFHGETDVGIYGMAATIVSAAGLLSQSVRTGVYPVMARVHRSSPDQFAAVYERLWRYLAIIAIPLMLLLMILADVIVAYIYNVDAPAAVMALRVLALIPALSFLNIPSARAMILENRQQKMMKFFFVSTGLNVLLSVFGAMTLGILGIALARVVSMAILFGMLIVFVYRHIVPTTGWYWMRRLGLACITISAVVFIVPEVVPSIWTALLVFLVYLFVVVTFGIVTTSEMQWFWNEFVRTAEGGS